MMHNSSFDNCLPISRQGEVLKKAALSATILSDRSLGAIDCESLQKKLTTFFSLHFKKPSKSPHRHYYPQEID